MVNDDGDESPSPEPRTDSRSALQRGFRAWRRLRIVKRDDFFSLFFFSSKLNIWSGVGVGDATGGPRGRGRTLGARPHPREKGVGPPGLHLWRGFFIVFSKMFRGVSGHSENFYIARLKSEILSLSPREPPFSLYFYVA